MARQRRVHIENKGLTIVAKPGFQILVFLLAVSSVTAVLLAVNFILAGSG